MAKEKGLMEHEGGAEPLSKQSSVEWAQNGFWQGFMKQAAIKIPKSLPRMPRLAPATEHLPEGVHRMSDAAVAAVKKPITAKPAEKALNYAEMNTPKAVPEHLAPTVEYGQFGIKDYKKAPKTPRPS
jgi:hypothetical protein